MTNFEKHTIIENNEIVAKELHRARIAKDISLTEASKQLKMNVAYLEAMETGNFEALPTGVYRVNFLREYAVFLGLPSSELVDLFLEGDQSISRDSKENLFVRKAKHVHYFITIPKLAKNLIIFSVSVVCFVYLVLGINAILSAPELEVYQPSLDAVINEKEIVVEGKTDPDAEIRINDELVLSDGKGDFSKKINLKKGMNTIVIVAHKKYSRKSELVKKVLVNEG